MIMKKKIMAVIVSVVSAVALASCGGASQSTTAKAAATTAKAATTAATTAKAAATTAKAATSAAATTKAAAATTKAAAASAAGTAASTGKTFTVGFDQDFPPMGFVGDDGKFTGFDLELAAEAAKRMGMEDQVSADLMGCQGCGAERRNHRLHLERFHNAGHVKTIISGPSPI
jgi:polar amino acid transport system substrate-binding protein